MKNQKGFSLIELLVVVIIIAIIAAIAIPSLLSSRRAANEASAIGSLRTIASAQHTYYATNPTGAAVPIYGTLVQLDGEDLIDAALAGGAKSGYNFGEGPGPTTSLFCVTAAPTTPTVTGDRYFATNQASVINAHTAAITCGDAAASYALSAGNPIQ